MRRSLASATAALLVLALLVPAASAAAPSHAGRSFTLSLTGAAEVPGPGDPDGSGTARLWLNPGLQRVCFELQVSNITLPATGAHIHVAPIDASGPVVVPLTAPGSDGRSSGCVSAERELIVAIIRSPASYYVNVHTLPLYAPGAVRAQLG